MAVSRLDEADRALMDSAARLLKRSHNAARLQIQAVDDPAAAAAAVDAGKADLAVIRTDVAIPADAQTVVILHRDSALLVAPASSGLKEIADLPGHAIGVVRMGAGNRGLIATVLSEADLKPDSVTLVELKPEEVEGALPDQDGRGRHGGRRDREPRTARHRPRRRGRRSSPDGAGPQGQTGRQGRRQGGGQGGQVRREAGREGRQGRR